MKLSEDIKLYLPKYLSYESTKGLLQEIKNFPNNINDIFYTDRLKNDEILFQGDAIKNLPVINLPDKTIKETPSIVLSNTCDLDLANKRAFSSQVCYAPIFNFSKYIDSLIKRGTYKDTSDLDQHIEAVRKQYITQILYLPQGGNLDYEGIVFLDRINNCHNTLINREQLSLNKIFTLSNYGFYLLLTKISIHFSRLQEKIDRDEGRIM